MASSTEAVTPSSVPSLLTTELLKYQSGAERTKSSAVSGALAFVAGGSAVAGFCFLVIRFYDGMQHWIITLMPPVGFVIGVLVLLFGLFRLIAALTGATKTIRCPTCSAEHDVFKSVTTFICPDCIELLRVGADERRDPAFVSCQYCGHRTAVCPDHGPFPCSDCGVVLNTDGRPESPDQDTCPGCDARLPSQALCCTTCDAVLEQDYLVPSEDSARAIHDQDWVAGKDAVGHFQYARALMNRVDADTPCPLTKRHPESPLRTLERTLLSLGEAAVSPETRDRCIATLPRLDEVYAGVLRWELDVTAAILESDETSDRQFISAVAAVAWGEIEDAGEAHLKARRQLERTLSGELDSSGGFGEWYASLIKWEKQEVRSKVSIYMTDTDTVLVGNKKLHREVERFSAWIEQRGGTPAEAWSAPPD